VSESRPWEENAAFWDAQMGDAGNEFHLRLIRPAVERLLGRVEGRRVLDVACGNGLFARRLAELGARVTATDVSQAMLEHARRRGLAQAASIDYRQCDVTDGKALVALGDEAFDAVVCNMALMDIRDVAPLASVMPRLLAAGGRFVFSITHPCFNRLGIRFVSESEYDAGNPVSRRGLLITRYLTPVVGEGVAIEGQPVNQLYFDRPLSLLLGPFFEAGLTMDALEEPAFPATEAGASLDWEGLPEIPPVLVARLRRQTAR
jgi:ubiquinone/menaquinone biosynthesis C-methylase UbiE